MNEINVKIQIMRDGVQLPSYATNGSAAFDLCCASDKPITIPPGGRTLVPTGIAISPETTGVAALLCARSGLASKHGIALSNGIGVIDSDYRGEISVAMVNISASSYTILPNDRIAQLMFVPVLHANLIPADSLDPTARGSGGFGSTGT